MAIRLLLRVIWSRMMPTHTSSPTVTTFFDEETSTLSYVFADYMESRVCAIIDRVLEFNESSAEITTSYANEI